MTAISITVFGCLIAVGLDLIQKGLREANRLKKIELKHMGISEEEIEGK